jgi:hypothetical protein
MQTRHPSATAQVAKCESARSPRQVSSLRPSRAPATAVSRATIHSERATRAERTPGSIRSAGCGAERAAQRHPVLRYSGTKVRSPTWRCQSLRALARRGVAGWTPSLTSSQLVRGGRAIDLIVKCLTLGRLATTKSRRAHHSMASAIRGQRKFLGRTARTDLCRLISGLALRELIRAESPSSR